jgi:hypothetical protein
MTFEQLDAHPSELDNAELLAMLGEIVQHTGTMTTWVQFHNQKAMLEALVALRDALIRQLPLESVEETDARKVLAAFDEEAQPWVQAGVPVSRYKMWKAYGFSFKNAVAWENANVPIEYAMYFARERFNPEWWPSWVAVHNLPDDETALVQMFHLLTSVNNLRLTPTTANKWVNAGVPVWDLKTWFSAGYTPAKAKVAIKKGVTVEQLADKAAPVPGPSWTKVEKLAKQYQWEYVQATQQVDGTYLAEWKGKKNSRLVARFKSDGKFDGCQMKREGNRTIRHLGSMRGLAEALPDSKVLVGHYWKDADT